MPSKCLLREYETDVLVTYSASSLSTRYIILGIFPVYRTLAYDLLVYKHGLNVAEALESIESPLGTDATLLVSTKGHNGGDFKVCVDPDSASLHFTTNPSRLFNVVGPD